jgi:hypothetical protein
VKVSRELPVRFQSGTGNGNKTYIINASYEQKEVAEDVKPYFVANGRIKRLD